MHPDPRQLRRLSWLPRARSRPSFPLPPLRLTVRLPPPPSTLSVEHRRELDRAHTNRRILVGSAAAVTAAVVLSGSVPGAAAVDASSGFPVALGEVGGGISFVSQWTGSEWVLVPQGMGGDKGGGGLPGVVPTDILDASDITDLGIPEVAMDAYRTAAASLAVADPACGLDWTLLAGIGRVETDHGQYGGRRPSVDGTVAPPILGVPLDGSPGIALIRDTDGGALDFDTVYDRAVGPMQFIPGTWAAYADADGNGDGRSDPHNLYDAALASATYLCAGSGDLSTGAGQQDAVYRYNNSQSYVTTVLAYADAYAAGVDPTGPPPAPRPVPRPGTPPTGPVHPPTSPTPSPSPTTPRPTTPPPTGSPTSAPPSGSPTGEPTTSPPPSTEPTTSTPPTTEPPTGCPTTEPPPTTDPTQTSDPGGTTDPGGAPDSSAPETSTPETSAPETTEPSTTEPSTTEPSTTDPGGCGP